MGYQNVVGQDSVNRFEKSFVKKKRPNNKKRNPNSPNATVEAGAVAGNRPPNQGQPRGNRPKGNNGGNRPNNPGQHKGNNRPNNPQGNTNENS
jgi:hypothetical protein